jgi:hypothetical protein
MDSRREVNLRRVGGTDEPGDDAAAVALVFAARMAAAGFTDEQVAVAHTLWRDFSDGRELRMQKPDALAGAVELAFGWVHALPKVNPTEVALRYRVTKSSLTQRYREIRTVLALAQHDPRY